MIRPKRSSKPFYCECAIPVAFKTPYHIGSGAGDAPLTDDPILRLPGGDGKPYIPGASIRGNLRDHIEREFPLLGCTREHCEGLFGPERKNRKDHFRGRLRVCDLYPSEKPLDEIRDHVAINPEWGAAAAGAKYDIEAVLPIENQGYTLRLIYEGDGSADGEFCLFHEAVRFIKRGRLRIGAKSGWGFGRLVVAPETVMQINHFDRKEPADLARYLDRRLNPSLCDNSSSALPAVLFSPTLLGQAAQSGTGSPALRKPWAYLDLVLAVQFEGPVIVKAPIPPQPVAGNQSVQNARNPETYGAIGAGEADMVFITRKNGKKDGAKYLPGSSLRGILRAQACRIGKISPLLKTISRPTPFDLLFGVKKEGTAGNKTLLEVGDGELVSPDAPVYFDHVAIDRITNAAEDGAKFSVSALVSPRFRVPITIRFTDNDMPALWLFGFLLRDLMESKLWAGAGVGRGYGYIKKAFIESCSITLPDTMHFSMSASGWTEERIHAGRRAWKYEAKAPGKFDVLKDLWALKVQTPQLDEGGAR